MAGTSVARLTTVAVVLFALVCAAAVSAQVATGRIVDNRSMQLALKVNF
jgi:hypothetical protein